MSEASTEASPATGQVEPLESSLWRELSEARTERGLAKAWLPLQCRGITGCAFGLILLAGDEPDLFEPIATWPEHAGKLPELSDAARGALMQRQGIVRASVAHGKSGVVVAFPIIVDDEVRGAVSIFSTQTSAADSRGILRDLQWGTVWIKDALRGTTIRNDKLLLDRSRAALDLLAETLEQERFQAAALAVATELALRFECTRVSIGFTRGHSVHVATISHTAQFRRQMDLIHKLTGAMNEAVDQRAVVIYPIDGPKDLATRAHADLSLLQRGCRLLTVPIFKVDRFVGAMTFERPADLAFEPEQVSLLEAVVATIGPVLDEKRRNDRWLGAKIGEALELQLVRLLGPGHLLRKLAAIAALALVVFFYFAQTTHRVDADARLEGLIRRSVIAPYDGFIREADVRAGDKVTKDQVLAALDDRDLALERLRWVTERQQRLYEYDKALASREPAAINVTKAQIDQAQAQIKLIDEQLSRDTLRAPIAGLVVAGDLSQMIGTSVNRGQVLFEIAPLDGYRVILGVDERQIGAIKVGQTGNLVTNALPDDHFAFKIDKLTPVAEPKGGRNVFRVEGLLTQNSDRLRPGMEGVAKVDIGQRRLIWVWTRPFIDWLRLWAWQYL